nr:immunoglobulin light chain junction region [Macaca mulatta]MOV92317.1 immunoglobulin light chain junction region [Macaca mulatta]MOV92446.1 immunoglobulin light chain junction region [Macaca mulatta]MOV92483.1 immunoglobulin light chain junction region [Macaca mulatta]MOV92518.1 immunoglobulin light chain junction region [Macaca mulatta]
CQQDYFYPLTF